MAWDELPIELIELIMSLITREDAKSLRRVSKALESKVSPLFFRSAVIPFNSELQSMVQRDLHARDASTAGIDRIHGSDEIGDSELPWIQPPPADDQTYLGYGYQVFNGFGRHIRNFGMSFEVNEDDLRRPPSKLLLDSHHSYFGEYLWPPKNYRRFDKLASLEHTADDMSHLRHAMSNLTNVRTLGLYLNNGHGFLAGDETPVKHRRPVMFSSAFQPGVETQAASVSAERNDQVNPGDEQGTDRENPTIRRRPSDDLPEDRPVQRIRRYGRLNIIVDEAFDIPSDHSDDELPTQNENSTPTEDSTTLIPSKLTKTQKEWLLEADWAQGAFLRSYTLSIVDNAAIFHAVRSFNFSFISSRFLPLLQRSDFWNAMPALSEVILHVSPDWRQIDRQPDQIKDIAILPSAAVNSFWRLLDRWLGWLPRLETLDLGWARSVEDSCNITTSHYLPAPIVRLEALQFRHAEVLDLPTIKHLTLRNCYLSYDTLTAFVRSLVQESSLKTLTLDRVSLLPPFAFAHPIRTDHGHRIPIREGIPDKAYRFDSWAIALNMIGPNEVVPGLAAAMDTPVSHTRLDRLELRNCGYVMSRAYLVEARAVPAIGLAHLLPDALGNLDGQAPIADRARRQDLAGLEQRAARLRDGFVADSRMTCDDPHMANWVGDRGGAEEESWVKDYGLQVHKPMLEEVNGSRVENQAGMMWIAGDFGRFSGVLTK